MLGLPTEEDLKKLSRRGMVCYALRCARRVMGYLPRPYQPRLFGQILIRIRAFCLDTSATDAAKVVKAEAVIADINVRFGIRIAADNDIVEYVINAFNAVAIAANAGTVEETAQAAVEASVFAYTAAVTKADDFANAATTDFKQLLELTGHQAGELGDPFDPGNKGPLGKVRPLLRSSVPHGYKVMSDIGEVDELAIPTPSDEDIQIARMDAEPDEPPLLKVYFDESSGITEDEELLVLTYLNLLYQQQGQPGLVIVEDNRHVYEGVPHVTG